MTDQLPPGVRPVPPNTHPMQRLLVTGRLDVKPLPDGGKMLVFNISFCGRPLQLAYPMAKDVVASLVGILTGKPPVPTIEIAPAGALSRMVHPPQPKRN